MSDFGESYTPTVRSRYKQRDIIPLNVCIKFDPYSISLYYKFKPESLGENADSAEVNMKYMHKVSIEKDIEKSVEDIYESLVNRDKPYWNISIISKRQVLKMIQKLKKGKDQLSMYMPNKKSQEEEKKINEDKKAVNRQMENNKEIKDNKEIYNKMKNEIKENGKDNSKGIKREYKDEINDIDRKSVV